MKRVRIVAMALLWFLAVGAVIGGVPMIIDPKSKWGILPISLLRYSPFDTFLIPGIILLTANGLLGFWVLWRVTSRQPHFGLWTAIQGCVLVGWIGIQCWMLRAVGQLHVLYFAVGLALIGCGVALRRVPAEPAAWS